MAANFHISEILTKPPIKRAAYSDRTAWLMSVMSALAYIRFEESTPIEELAKSLAKESSERKVLASLTSLLAAENRDQAETELISDLKLLGFTLESTYSVSIPLVVDTQAFLAKLTLDNEREPFLVLSFRGTELKKAADIKADIRAIPTIIGPESTNIKVHSGFYDAFHMVKSDISTDLSSEKYRNLPLYITGHSLGGALAIVATYFLSSDQIAACYTFGGPRVGNLDFGQSIKPPIYRIINAADLVPRLPPSYFIEGLTLLIRWLPVIPYHQKIAGFLDKFRHYRHCGDLRYLSAGKRKESETEGGLPVYSNLQVISNPPQLSRWFWLYRRLFANGFQVGIADHNIATYIEKLANWGIKRNS